MQSLIRTLPFIAALAATPAVALAADPAPASAAKPAAAASPATAPAATAHRHHARRHHRHNAHRSQAQAGCPMMHDHAGDQAGGQMHCKEHMEGMQHGAAGAEAKPPADHDHAPPK